MMKIKIGFFAIMLGISLILSHSLFSLAALLAALSHELGHILMARCCGIRFKECAVGIYGAGLEPCGELYSYGREILLCLAGPVTNLLLGSLGLVFCQLNGSFPQYFVFSSFALGFLNLLPIRGFDGGRILHAFLSYRFSPKTASRIIEILSFFFIFLLWCLSVYLLLKATSSLSLFVFSLSLFGRIFISEP